MSASASPPVLDHVVVNVLDRLDAVADQFTRLGFALTERGHHTLGSSNHLAIFGTDYLELLGYMPGRETSRADLWAHPPGLTGLVFKSDDPARTYEDLRGRGVPVLEPVSFARPVALSDGERDARFTVVRVAGEAVANGRTFFCHHVTPDLVWRPEWRVHPNGVEGIAEFVIASREPARAAALYDRMFGPDLLEPVEGGVGFRAGAARVSILEPAAAERRFPGLLSALPQDGGDRMVALVFRTRSRDAAGEALRAGGVAHTPYLGDGLAVAAASAGNVAAAFVAR